MSLFGKQPGSSQTASRRGIKLREVRCQRNGKTQASQPVGLKASGVLWANSQHLTSFFIFLLHKSSRGREEVKKFMVELREVFHDLDFHSVSDLEAEGDYVVGDCEGGGTHIGSAFSDFLWDFFRRTQDERCDSGGRTVLRIMNGAIAEEIPD